MKLSRKEFLLAMGGVISVGLMGCGDGDSATPDMTMAGGSDCLTDGTKSTISGNHGHAITVTVAEIQAAADKTYDVTGQSAHSHSYSLSAADYAALAKGTSVTHTTSDGGGHTHTITILCA